MGQRLAWLAEKYVYGNSNIAADAPEVAATARKEKEVIITFNYGDGLHLVQEDGSSYNGFLVKNIPTELLPKVTAGVNGLQVLVNGEEVSEVVATVKGDSLILTGDAFAPEAEIQIKYAKTGFYQLNLLNGSGIPVKPFSVTVA